MKKITCLKCNGTGKMPRDKRNNCSLCEGDGYLLQLKYIPPKK